MTREEAIEVINAYRDKLTNSASNQLDGDIEAFNMAISALNSLEEVYAKGYNDGFTQAEVNYENDKALSQEPCTVSVSEKEPNEITEEVTLRFFKNSLKVRWHDFVIYNVEWLKKNWQMEMDIVCGVKPCDDAISREAVYSILKEYHIDEEEIESVMDDCQNLTVNGITSDVSLLPSVIRQTECLKAQAKKQAMPMSCDDCCYEPNSPFCKMYRKDICEKKDERQTGKWIPFSERLPKPFERCLITTIDGEVIYHYDDGHYSKYKAWMPLPEPYKAESEE